MPFFKSKIIWSLFELNYFRKCAVVECTSLEFLNDHKNSNGELLTEGFMVIFLFEDNKVIFWGVFFPAPLLLFGSPSTKMAAIILRISKNRNRIVSSGTFDDHPLVLNPIQGIKSCQGHSKFSKRFTIPYRTYFDLDNF